MVGAGGFLPNVSIASDNTMVIRTDVFGGYKWNASVKAPNGTTGTWQQLLNVNSMPASFQANGQNFQDGIYEIQVCYSNSSIMYMMFLGFEQTGTTQSTVYKSTNTGANWVATGYAPVAQQGGNQGGIKQFGPKLAIDRLNCSNVIVGTNTLGTNTLQYSNDGGTSWTTVSTGQVPAANGNGYSGLVVNGNTAFVCSIGNGVYTTTGGFAGTWTKLINGTGPGANGCEQADYDATNGMYYAIDTGFNLWRWNGTIWHEDIVGSPNDANVAAISIDPQNASHVVAVANHGEINETVNAGTSWSGFSSVSVTISTTGDIPWMYPPLGAGTVTPNNCVYDRTVVRTIYCPSGNGFWSASWSGAVTGATVVNWVSMGRGIEELVGLNVMSSPNYATPFVGSWDRAIFHPNLTNYPSVIAPVNDTTLTAGFSLDYDGPGATGTICAAVNGNFYGNNVQRSGCTSDGSTWAAFAAFPTGAYPATVFTVENLAVGGASNVVFVTSGIQPHYTTNSGGAWNAIGACSGVASWAGILPGSEFNGGTNTRVIAADKVNAGTFLVYLAGTGFFKLTANGATCAVGAAITSVPSGASFGAQMQVMAVPTVASEYWVSVGAGAFGGPPNLVSGLAFTTNGGTSFTAVTNMTGAASVGFGLHAVGQTHPTVYVGGWFNQSVTGQSFTIANTGTATVTVPSGLNLAAGSSVYFDDGAGNAQWGTASSYNNGTGSLTMNLVVSKGSGTHSSWTFMAYGIWQCTVSCTTATPAWTQMLGWPANSFDNITTVYGDASILNRFYVGFGGGSGFKKFNFLLKRDLNPTNDNTPMWLNEVA